MMMMMMIKVIMMVMIKRMMKVMLSQGQPVDGPHFGISPQPWDIQVMLPQRFEDRVEKVRVPHSSIVKVEWNFSLLQLDDGFVCSLYLQFN